MIEKIVIYHTNDIHSHFDTWPNIKHEVIRKRKIHQENDESMFLFDIGDHIDRFHPYTEAYLGKGNIRLLNECNFDAVTIGNNEGITLAQDDLLSLYDEAHFDVVLANLYFKNGMRPEWAKPYQIYETNNGVTIGVIGVTVNFTNFYEPLGWNVTDPFMELERLVPEVRAQSDILVVLSHLGLSEDERMAKLFPQIDVILGAHTHHVLENGQLVENTLLCCTGKYGMNLGKVELQYDLEKHKIISKHATLIPAHELQAVETSFAEVLYEKGKQKLLNPVAFLPEKLERDWFNDSPLNELLASTLTEWCKADCSFLNAGVLLDDLQAGIVTEYDIHRICPHPLNPCTVELSGAELKELLVQTVDDQYMTLQFKGFGFRGEIFGKIIYDQISITGEGSNIQIEIRDEMLDMDRIYKVATLDMFTFGRFYPSLTRAKKRFFLPEFLRDLLKHSLSKHYPLDL